MTGVPAAWSLEVADRELDDGVRAMLGLDRLDRLDRLQRVGAVGQPMIVSVICASPWAG